MMPFTGRSACKFNERINTQLLMMTFTDLSACKFDERINTPLLMMAFTERSVKNENVNVKKCIYAFFT
jgi:hypothetical protein